MYKKQENSLFQNSYLIVIDIISLAIAFVAAYFVNHNNFNGLSSELYSLSLFFLLSIHFFVIMCFRTAFSPRAIKKIDILATLLQTIISMSLFAIWLLLFKNADLFSRMVFVLTPLFFMVLSLLLRLFFMKFIYLESAKTYVYITQVSLLDEVSAEIEEIFAHSNHICKLIVLDEEVSQRQGCLFVQTTDEILDYLHKNWVDEVFILMDNEHQLPNDLIINITEMGIVSHIKVNSIFNTHLYKQMIENINGTYVLTTTINYVSTLELFIKRVTDIIGGFAGCLITIILALILGPMIYISSPGPIFYSQLRVGRNGKLFKIYKFRSMYMNADEKKALLLDKNEFNGDLMFKINQDPRIIGSKIDEKGNYKPGIGNTIRKLSLDEFPQFFNVLMGDMSIVGTRPPTTDEWSRYEPRHRSRLAIKPGITGLWQVGFRNKAVDFEEVVKIDREYIESWSFALDMKIILKTVKSILKGEGQ